MLQCGTVVRYPAKNNHSSIGARWVVGMMAQPCHMHSHPTSFRFILTYLIGGASWDKGISCWWNVEPTSPGRCGSYPLRVNDLALWNSGSSSISSFLVLRDHQCLDVPHGASGATMLNQTSAASLFFFKCDMGPGFLPGRANLYNAVSYSCSWGLRRQNMLRKATVQRLNDSLLITKFQLQLFQLVAHKYRSCWTIWVPSSIVMETCKWWNAEDQAKGG